ncbi:hypothetical protein cyc_03087 [Cyclospora cayetanensis]|uniref:Uncharacterized protein n=1 Tax=Cyclospora cayetanensis TaxID=88456 RepID=A0A1D3D478_9EIME|nr:hypothetical protein cyc_03087 [Cyclospora cayetanensis]
MADPVESVKLPDRSQEELSDLLTRDKVETMGELGVLAESVENDVDAMLTLDLQDRAFFTRECFTILLFWILAKGAKARVSKVWDVRDAAFKNREASQTEEVALQDLLGVVRMR